MVVFFLCGTKYQDVIIDADGVRFQGYNFADFLNEYFHSTVHSKRLSPRFV